MSKTAIDSEYLSSVWTRINSAILEQGANKADIAEKCGFDRKILSHYGNLTLTYFARLCEELNVSADFFLFGLDKKKEKTNYAAYSSDKYYGRTFTTHEIMKITKEKKITHNGTTISLNNKCGISVQKELMIFADDFRLLHRKDVQEIIETCKSYSEGQQKIMRVYETVYLK